jgi:L-serine dehydratase
MGPEAAAKHALKNWPDADGFKVTLYGSLALTGKGHMTDAVIRQTLAPIPSEIVFDLTTPETELPHPNTLDIQAFKGGVEIGRMRAKSIGGGSVRVEGIPFVPARHFYKEENFGEIYEYCNSKGIRLWQYVEEKEGPEVWDYLGKVWDTMKNSIREGLENEGVLPGGLEVQRKAGFLYNQYNPQEEMEIRENRMVCAYAYAVSEQNASSGTVVTAPTCGSCGVVPAVLYYYQNKHGIPDSVILHGLAAGGVIGNIVKTNASISGAECGCQAEIGTACCMASAALAEVRSMSLAQIEYAAEISMEHMLGLTCDPIGGLVQIPCIERNAVAAMRSINAVSLAHFLTDTRKISFDLVVKTMYETGRDLRSGYRETAEGGLAKLYSKE